MAIIHPSIEHLHLTTPGAYRERDVLLLLEEGLPLGFDVYHSVNWSVVKNGKQRFGEIDVVVLSPFGHIAILEVKAGEVLITEHSISKNYAGHEKDIGQQLGSQFSAWKSRIHDQGIDGVKISHFLILPDQKTSTGSISFPRERIIDSTQMESMCQLIQKTLMAEPLPEDQRMRLQALIENKFDLLPDPSVRIGQVRKASKRIADGLATWATRVHHQSGVYKIEATAGSGKTQLALALLQDAARSKLRGAYVCFNRPLADHIAKVAPPNSEVGTFHEICIDHYRKTVGEPDFSKPDVFELATSHYLQSSEELRKNLDILIIDESQDFQPGWISGLFGRLKADSRLYVMSDPEQGLYDREGFDLPDAVEISCQENFRSPQKIVETINRLKMTKSPIIAKGVHVGETPEFITYEDISDGGLKEIEQTIDRLIQEGYTTDQMTILSFSGLKNSKVLTQETIGKYKLNKFTGGYDKAGNALWTNGDVLAETIYRFKGQSAPIIILCEIDFESIGTKELRKLFVGFTRAQFHLINVVSHQAAELIMERI
jgi:hypothetical protein